MTLPDIDTSITRPEAERLVELARSLIVLEVGAWRGFSTVAMGQVARRVYSVDHHKGDEHAGHDESLSYLVDNVRRYGLDDGRVVIIVADSVDILPAFAAPMCDMAFIDAFHDYDAVRRDTELVWPLVRKGGRIAFHDYGRWGVKQAVDELHLPIDLTETLAVVTKPW